MKRSLAVILMLAFMMTFAVPASAAADVSITATPATLEAAGAVNIEVTVKNTGDGTLSGIKVKGNGVDKSYEDTIAPGESKKFAASLNLTLEQLGRVLSFNVTWTNTATDGTAKEESKTVTLTVNRSNFVSLTAARTTDKNQVRTGESITLTYTLTNTGSVVLKNITLTDEEISDSPIKKGFSLQVGEELKITYTYTMKKETVVSKPVIKYTPANGTPEQVHNIAEKTLGMVNTQLQFEIVPSDNTPNGIDFLIRVTNNGNQRIKNITVTDNKGTKLNSETFTLAVGESKDLNYHILPTAEETIYFVAKGVDATNQNFEDKTKSQTVRPYVDPSTIKIEMIAAVVEQLKQDGSIRVRFDINNTGTLTMQSGVISELVYGEVEQLSTIAPGTTAVDKVINVGEPRDLEFTLSIKDNVGNTYDFKSYITAAYLGSVTGEDPGEIVVDPGPAIGNVGATLNSTLSALFTLFAVLAVLSGIALIVFSTLERKEARRLAQRKARRMHEQNSRSATMRVASDPRSLSDSGTQHMKRPPRRPDPRIHK